MAFFATFALIFLVIFRPMEIWPVLEAAHLMDLFTALALGSVIFDFVMRRFTPHYAPQLPLLGAFLVYCYISTIVATGKLGLYIVTVKATIPAVFMVVTVYGARTVAQLKTLIRLLIVLCVFISGVAIQQGLSEPQCIEIKDTQTAEEGTPDGRSCETRATCYKGDFNPSADYECERLGWFDTITIQRRVRWRGQLGDPNELSVYIGIIIPLLLVMASLTGKKGAVLYTLPFLGILFYAVILSQSRGGQLVIGTIFASYFISRYRWKGIFGGLLALPVLLLGGRSGDGDDAGSADERTDLLYEGINFVIHHPVLGIGVNQFAEEVHLTAHNSYLLAAAEAGMPGFFLWSMMFWASVKVPLTAVRDKSLALSPEVRQLAMALVTSFLGFSVGIFFLSFTFKQLLFVWVGLSGAMYGILKKEDPNYKVTLGWRDIVGVLVFNVFLIAAIFVYSRIKAR